MSQTFTLLQFNRLPNPDKYAALEDHGVYLKAYRVQGAFKIALFSLWSYYVEVWLHQAADELRKAVAFDEYERLDPFLSSIDVSALYCRL